MPIENIALRFLEMSPLNVRKSRDKATIESLAASVLTHGLIQNLRVHTQDEGMYAVVVGGTRLAALQLLLKQKKITEDYQVACEVRPANDPTLLEVSLSENFNRTAMRPVEEFESFQKLAEAGQSAETIAARFGTTAQFVKQRMKLAALHPKLIKVLRADEMTIEQAMAFTISDDTKQQLKVWSELPAWVKERGDGDHIRAALTEQHAAADSKLAKFVGIDIYQKAGGHITRDLFDDEGAGWLTDTDLLNRIVEEKLSSSAEAVKAEGWKWVRHAPAFSWEDTQKDGRMQPTNAPPTPEQQAKIDEIQARMDRIMEEHGEEPEDADAYRLLYDLQQEVDGLSEGAEIWTDEQKAVAGVYVSIGHDGELSIKRGIVKPDDKAAAKKLDKGLGGDTDEPESPAKPKGGLPASLIAELTSHKTVAAQLVMATKPDAALLAVTHALAIQTLYAHAYGSHSALKITANEPTYPMAIRESVEKSAPAKKLAALVKATQNKLPKKPEQLWTWLEAQTPATIRGILAVAAALTIDVVQSNGADATPAAVALTKIIGLDMSLHWEASAENYFTRVPKKHLLAELNGALKPTTRKAIEGMKRDAMGKTLQTELKGKKWLPAVLKVG